MAMTNRDAALRPRWPDLDELPSIAQLDYDPVTDSLLVAFDRTRPAENAYLDTGNRDYISLRLALETEEVVGIEVEDLEAVALPRHPSWRRLVAIAGDRTFQRVAPVDRPAVAAFITDVARIPLR